MNALKLGAVSLSALALAAAASGCGSSPDSRAVAGAGSTTTNKSSSLSPPSGGGGTSGGGGGSLTMVGGNVAAMRRFASCMRSHGVSNFPDPSANGSVTLNGVNPDSPAFQNAQKACRKYTPNGGQPPSPAEQAKMQAQALKFSACMRAHGVPKFPDPQFSGGHASLRIGPSSGIDPRSPIFQAAQKACQKDLPGKVQSQRAGP